MDQVIQFITNHWMLATAWVVLAILLLFTQIKHMTSGIKSLVPAQVTHLINKQDGLVIDMRAMADFNKGHIAGAKNIPQSKLKESLSELEKYKSTPIIMVCANGITAGPACAELKKAGFEQVHKLAGGHNGWIGDNLPVVRS